MMSPGCMVALPGLLMLVCLPQLALPSVKQGDSMAAGLQRAGAYIDLAGSPNVSVSLGRTATLRCRIVNVMKKTVSWLRHKDVNLLSVGRYIYTKDRRMKVMEDRGRGEWILRIQGIRHSDSGQYECQVNTSPLLAHTVTLSVVEPYTEILGDSPGSTLYIDIRSVLNLTCLVHSPEVPAAIFWKRDGQVALLRPAPPRRPAAAGAGGGHPDGGGPGGATHPLPPLPRPHRHPAERPLPVQPLQHPAGGGGGAHSAGQGAAGGPAGPCAPGASLHRPGHPTLYHHPGASCRPLAPARPGNLVMGGAAPGAELTPRAVK